MRLGNKIALLGLAVSTCTLLLATELHDAVKARKIKRVAQLLRNGSNTQQCDTHGKKAFDYASEELLTQIRYAYQHFPREQAVKKMLPTRNFALSDYYLQQLEEKGIVKIPRFINTKQLTQLRSDFATFIENITTNNLVKTVGFTTSHGNKKQLRDDYYQDNAKVFISHNPFRFSPLLTSLCCSKKLTDIINNYFGEKSYIRQGVALRYLPLNKHATCTDQWHHDGTGKAINVMMLLTDIGEGDQYMTYVERSHTIRHDYNHFFGRNMFFSSSPAYAEKQLGEKVRIYKAQGKAGDIFVFNSNGTHSANRTLGAIRDVFIVVYHTDTSSMWNFTLPKEALPKKGYHPFEKNKPHAKQLYPVIDNWRDSLQHPELWLQK